MFLVIFYFLLQFKPRKLSKVLHVMCGKNTAMFTFLRERNSQKRASSFETEYDGDKKP